MRKECASFVATFFYSLVGITLLSLISCGGGGGSNSPPSSNTPSFYSISGTVTSSGIGLQGVTMTLSGPNSATATTEASSATATTEASSATVITDASGNFSFLNLANGSYIITPSMSGSTFIPINSTQIVNGANINGVNFIKSGGGVDSISMLTPYLNNFDMASIHEAFSSTSSAPWGFEHNGVDFFPAGNNKPFQAVASGTVEAVRLWQNDRSSNWQVNVMIKVNPTYSVEYAFEPFSTSQTDGNTQLANISVSMGQIVAQGTVIGNLFTVAPAAHVHFTLLQNSISICPENYFTTSAKDSVLRLIHKDHPTWNMCY